MDDKGFKVVDVMIKKVDDQEDGSLLAYASVNFGNQFVVHNIKLLKGDNGIYIGMPRRKTRNGEYKDIAHPINAEFRKYLQDTIIRSYEEDKQ